MSCSFSAILHPFTLKERCKLVSRQLHHLQLENSQLLSLCSEKAKDVEDVRTLLNNTKALLAEKERSRRIKIYQSDAVQTSIVNIERCSSAEKLDRLNDEKQCREIKVKEEQLEIAALDEWFVQEDLKSRLSSLEVLLKHVECGYETEQERQEQLKKETIDYEKEVAQIECSIRGLKCQLNMEETLLKAEETAENKWSVENKVSEEMLERKFLQEEDLQKMIDDVKNQIKNIEEENETLGSCIKGQKKRKLVS